MLRLIVCRQKGMVQAIGKIYVFSNLQA